MFNLTSNNTYTVLYPKGLENLCSLLTLTFDLAVPSFTKLLLWTSISRDKRFLSERFSNFSMSDSLRPTLNKFGMIIAQRSWQNEFGSGHTPHDAQVKGNQSVWFDCMDMSKSFDTPICNITENWEKLEPVSQLPPAVRDKTTRSLQIVGGLSRFSRYMLSVCIYLSFCVIRECSVNICQLSPTPSLSHVMCMLSYLGRIFFFCWTGLTVSVDVWSDLHASIITISDLADASGRLSRKLCLPEHHLHHSLHPLWKCNDLRDRGNTFQSFPLVCTSIFLYSSFIIWTLIRHQSDIKSRKSKKDSRDMYKRNTHSIQALHLHVWFHTHMVSRYSVLSICLLFTAVALMCVWHV